MIGIPVAQVVGGPVRRAARPLGVTCSVTDCGRAAFRRGWCRGHYRRSLRHGDVLADLPLQDNDDRPLLDRYEIASSGCWLWTGAFNDDGYGTHHRQLAHRAVYELKVGPVADGLVLDHTCRVRACVNPDHLEPVSHAENMRRARRSVCRRGHALTPDNTYVTPSTGARTCRTCKYSRRSNGGAS